MSSFSSVWHLAAVTVLGVGVIACTNDGPVASGDFGFAAASATEPAAPGDTIEFRASEFGFEATVLVAEPGEYTGVLINDGAIEHDIIFDGASAAAAHAAAGETVEFEFTVPEGGISYWCSIAGHEEAGMTGHISTPGGADASSHDHEAATTGAASGNAGTEVLANPDAAPYELRDPHPPARGEGDGVTLVPGGAPGGGDLIEWELVIEERLMTVAEGFEQQVWTFGGQLPGPVLRTKVGDTVRVRLINPPESEVSHSIDFHASQVSMEGEMDTIAPGEELVYEFTTDYAGVFMYHCGTSPVLHHIANGMYGMVIVEPAEGLPPVDEELFFVQSEWYLGPQGDIASLANASAAAPAPDFQMFNGVASQYADNPISIGTGDDTRLFVLNAGPSVDTSIHVVGTIFHRVIAEGVVLEEGNEGNWGAQAVSLAPAQGAVIDMRTAEDGKFVLVNHAFNMPGRGAIAVFMSS